VVLCYQGVFVIDTSLAAKTHYSSCNLYILDMILVITYCHRIHIKSVNIDVRLLLELIRQTIGD